MKPATTISELFDDLDALIDTARRRQSRLGYFPAVYRYVVSNLRTHYASGRFHDPERIDQVALGLFNRYFEALQLYQAGELPARSWLAAFEAAQSRWPTVGQQIFLSINPHINLDLGIVVGRLCPGDQLPAFRDDFFEMNAILAPLVVDVVACLDSISPLAGLFRGRARAAGISFLIDKMGAHAWRVAQQLARLSEPEQSGMVTRLDRQVETLGQLIVGASPTLALFRLTERGSVAQIIDTLSQMSGGA